jgi:hypothetical protein
VRYELGFYIPEDKILHGHRRENLKSDIALPGRAQQRRRHVFPVRYELGFYISEDKILHGHRRENLRSDIPQICFLACQATWYIYIDGMQ